MIDATKIDTGEFKFDCRIAGEKSNDPVILLHGFPETSVMWTRLMESLIAQGYYCIAPDMRGYSQEACPKGKKHYSMDLLRTDIFKIADALEISKFHLIGHDWGAAVGWNMVYNNPDRIISWTAVSIPHNRAFLKAIKTDPVQKKKSRYIGFFLLPVIPELVIRRNDFNRFRKLWKHSSAEDIEQYLTVFRRKGSLTGALNYYRANIGKGKYQPVGDIEPPTLFIWGNRDLAVGEVAAKGVDKYIKGDYQFVEVDGGHWLLQSNFSEVEEAVLKHLSNI